MVQGDRQRGQQQDQQGQEGQGQEEEQEDQQQEVGQAEQVVEQLMGVQELEEEVVELELQKLAVGVQGWGEQEQEGDPGVQVGLVGVVQAVGEWQHGRSVVAVTAAGIVGEDDHHTSLACKFLVHFHVTPAFGGQGTFHGLRSLRCQYSHGIAFDCPRVPLHRLHPPGLWMVGHCSFAVVYAVGDNVMRVHPRQLTEKVKMTQLGHLSVQHLEPCGVRCSVFPEL